MWLEEAAVKLACRVQKAIELDHCAAPEREIKSTTSAVDVTTTFFKVRKG